MRGGIGVLLLAVTLSACTSDMLLKSSGKIGEGPHCALAETVKTSVHDILRSPEQFDGKCVSLAGVFDGDDIFSTLKEAVQGSQPPFEQKGETAIGAFVDAKRLDMNAFWSGEFTGRIETCRDAYRKMPPASDAILERWIHGCQHYQTIHLTYLTYENLRRVGS